MADLPRGTVTFLFTDVEGSTRLLHELGAEAYARALTEHRRVLRDAFAAYAGVEIDTQGDAFFVAFSRATDAAACAAAAQAALADGPVSVRMGIHTGEPLVTDEGYVGVDVHRAARIAAAGHGGQVLLSESARQLAGGDGLRDLGEHRLKDLTAPERIWQLGERDFPPLTSLNRTNLPVQPTPLIGREAELGEVLTLLHSSPLLTLTGPGGSGKTRLALQAAAEVVEEFPDGVWFVSLAALTDSELILPTIVSTVGATDDVLDFLRTRRLLLLLDNLEQLLPDAAPVVATLVSENVKVLATSRERLAIAAEQQYAVPTLLLDDAVALFTTRARQLTPSFQPDEHVAAIAHRVDGLPLALELAAARVKVLPTEDIAARLGRSLEVLTSGARDAPARQRTLRATIEWSYDLLTERERRLFASLAVFVGSFDPTAAELVCGADLDALQSLVDKSLLRQSDDYRLFMLETIREYALERLETSEEGPELRTRHAQHFAGLAEEAEPKLKGGAQREWLDRLGSEQGNFRAALAWCRERQDVTTALRLVGSLWIFWMVRGDLKEAFEWVERALALEGGDPGLRAKACLGGSYVGVRAGAVERARQLADEGIALCRALGDSRGAAHALRDLGNALIAFEEFDRARALYEESAALSRELDDRWNLAIAMNNLGYTALCIGDAERAREACDESRTLRREVGDKRGEVLSLANRSLAELAAGRVAEASHGLRDCIRLARELDFYEGLSEGLVGLAAISMVDGDADLAARLIGALEGLTDHHGFAVTIWPVERRLYEGVVADATRRLGEARFAQACDEGRAAPVDEILDALVAAPLPG